MLLLKESVLSLKVKTTQDWCSYFQSVRMYLNPFMTDLLNNICDCFGI